MAIFLKKVKIKDWATLEFSTISGTKNLTPHLSCFCIINNQIINKGEINANHQIKR